MTPNSPVSVSVRDGTDHTPVMFLPGVLTSMWGEQVRRLADDLGIELDEVRERVEKWVKTVTIRVHDDESRGWQDSGSAIRASTAISDGDAVITMEHVNRLTDDAAPEWEYPPDGYKGVHRVMIEGS